MTVEAQPLSRSAVPAALVAARRRVAPRPATGNALVALLAFAAASGALMQTLVLPLLPQFPRLLHSSPGTTSWMATATLVAGAVANPLLGRLADMYGKRRVLLGSLLALAVGSLTCALANDLPVLLTGRSVQGASTGVIPIAISILRDELPAEKVSGAIGLISATMGIGSGIGVPLAGVLVAHSDWHTVFWVATALAVVGAAAIHRWVPDSPAREHARFDGLGAFGLSVVLLLLLVPVSKGADWGFASPPVLTAFAAAAGVGTLWVRYQMRREAPAVDLRVATRRPVLLTNVAGLFVGIAMFVNFLVTIDVVQLPATAELGFGRTLVAAGLCLLPGTLAMIVLAPLSGRLSTRRGPRFTLVLGATIITAGFGLRVVLTGSLLEVILGAFAVSAGVAISFAALPTLVVANVDSAETAAANGVNTLSRVVGCAIGSALFAAVTSALTSNVGGTRLPSTAAFITCFAIGGISALVAVCCATAIPRPRAEPKAATGARPPVAASIPGRRVA